MLRFETYSYTCRRRVVDEREEVPFEVVMLKLQTTNVYEIFYSNSPGTR